MFLMQGRRERAGRGRHHFQQQNIFFHEKLENKIFTCEELMRLEFIY